VKQAQPLLTRAGIVTALSVLAALLVHLGAGNVSDWLGEHADQIAGLLLAVGPIVTGLLARAHVTPVASPKDNAGNRLVPAATSVKSATTGQLLAVPVDDDGSVQAALASWDAAAKPAAP
jgi:hypothetical protein